MRGGEVGNLLDKHAGRDGWKEEEEEEEEGLDVGFAGGELVGRLVGLSDYYGFRLLVCFGLSLSLSLEIRKT